jgi:hypothetical protein
MRSFLSVLITSNSSKFAFAVEKFLVVRDTVLLDREGGVVEAVRETADVSFPVGD